MLRLADSEPRLAERQGISVHHGSEVVDLDVAEFVRSERVKAAVTIVTP